MGDARWRGGRRARPRAPLRTCCVTVVDVEEPKVVLDVQLVDVVVLSGRVHARVAEMLVDGCEELLVGGLDHLRGGWNGCVRRVKGLRPLRPPGRTYRRHALEQGHALLAVVGEILSALGQRILRRRDLLFKDARVLRIRREEESARGEKVERRARRLTTIATRSLAAAPTCPCHEAMSSLRSFIGAGSSPSSVAGRTISFTLVSPDAYELTT